jgi:ionotropic glutamate receptor
MEYGLFKISYKTHKEKWSINELFTICVQEEKGLRLEKPESAHLVSQAKKMTRRVKQLSK